MEETDESIVLRRVTVTDAAAFADFVPLLDAHAEFMLFEPKERGDFGIKESRAKINAESRHGVLIGAFVSAQRLIGYVSAQGSALRRIRHVLYLVVGVLPAYGHHGIGTELLGAVEEWGLARVIRRLELTVVCTGACEMTWSPLTGILGSSTVASTALSKDCAAGWNGSLRSLTICLSIMFTAVVRSRPMSSSRAVA